MRTTFRRIQILALTAAWLLPLSLASAHPDEPGAEPFGRPGIVKNVARTLAITLNDTMRFSPNRLTVRQGETIRLHITNAGRAPHEFVLGTSEELAEHAEMMRQMPDMVHNDASAVRLAAGQSADLVWQFSRSGTFPFACLLPGHREAGMEGQVIVLAAKAKKG